MSDYEDIMDLLGGPMTPASERSPWEPHIELPPIGEKVFEDTTHTADVWLPTSVAMHYREYDRSGPAVDELEEQIRQQGLLTPIRISTDGEVAVVHEGNHRLQVAQRLGIPEVPAIVTFDSPVRSNGGRVTPLEPVLASWVDANRGSLRSFWGHRTANAEKLYRGFHVDLLDLSVPDDLYELFSVTLWDNPGAVAERMIQWVDEAGVGGWWTRSREVAEWFASGGPGRSDTEDDAWLVIAADWDGSGEGTSAHQWDNYREEKQVILEPGTRLSVTDVWVNGIHVPLNRQITANPDVIVRGFCFSGASFDLAQKYMNGSVSASDIISDIERQWGSVGIWWGTVGSSADDFYSSVEDARGYAAGAGDEYVADQWEWMEEYHDGASADLWVGAEVEVVLVGKRPQRDYGAWNPTLDNGEGSVWESTSFLSEGDRIELVEVQYSFDGTTWKTESAGGLTVTAHRTAGTEYAPGPVYRGINTDMLTDDELDEIEEWAAANAYSQNNYQLAEPNYGLIHRIVDRFESSGLGRHWSKDYDVSASFARDQGDNIAIIFIGDWDGQGVDDREFHRGWDGVQRPSNVEHEKEVTLMPGSQVTLVGVDVVMPNGFTSNIPVPTIQVTAHRTATNDLRVHLFDSEGHEMFLEPDFDGNPWTYHPKVMQAVRFLADVAQTSGVYWHMDHNEWIPSKITDFKVFDGPNDVTHEIKEFPQLRGYYASRTAAVDYLLQKLLDECETSETSYHDYAILQSLMTIPEEVLDTHPFAWELKKCQQEARESEYPETDNVLVEWLIEINKKGKDHQSRTAAEPGGVLPWNPSTNGYYWITKNDDSLEAVTNDGVNRMRLYEKPWGWEWVVKDDIGVVEKGNFGTALRGGDALRDRADDLLSEFDSRPLRRTRGPSRGYQDDYTQAPNELWGSRRATTSDRYREMMTKRGVRHVDSGHVPSNLMWEASSEEGAL